MCDGIRLAPRGDPEEPRPEGPRRARHAIPSTVSLFVLSLSLYIYNNHINT